MAQEDRLTLLSLLSNPLVLRQTHPHLSIADVFNLGATSKAFRNLIYNDASVFRYLDLTTAKGAKVHIAPIDRGGETWRSQRMDEGVTEEDFYCGPLRGILSSLLRRKLLGYVQTLVLDGQAAPVEVLHEIINADYQVRILSVRGCTHLNDDRLQQALKYATRSSRPEGSLKLQGIYRLGGPPYKNATKSSSFNHAGHNYGSVTTVSGAQLGTAWNHRSVAALSSSLSSSQHTWYSTPGRVFHQTHRLESWAPVLRACEGLIHFDAVLCHGPRHYLPVLYGEPEYVDPAVASVVLAGCERCGGMPESRVRPSDAPSPRLPLLHPPPRHSASIRLAQQPEGELDRPLFARCASCLAQRCCESCFRFWCEDCYSDEELRISRAEKRPVQTRTVGAAPDTMTSNGGDDDTGQESVRPGTKVLIHLGLCVGQCLVEEMRSGAGSDGMWG